MSDAVDVPPVKPHSTAVLGAAAASVAAALVHAAAAGTHSGAPELVRLFAICAAVQAVVAGAALVSGSKATMATVAAVNVAAVAAWGFSRTTGLPWPELLQESEEVGAQDLAAAALGAVAALLAGIAVFEPRWASAKASPTALAGMATVALLAVAIPGMTAQHDHGEGSHDHAHEGDVETATAAEDGHAHDGSTDELAADAATGGGAPPTGPVVSLGDVRLTSAQRDAAQDLIDATDAGMARFTDQASVEAAGFRSIGDSVTGFEHFVNYDNLLDGNELDPDHIESIVFTVAPDGTKEVASAMYIMSPGNTMDDVPDIAGELTTWHDHQNLCWDGLRVVAVLDDSGRCPRGEFRPTPPMLHVWLPGQEPECGPFAGIEGSHGSGCDHAHG